MTGGNCKAFPRDHHPPREDAGREGERERQVNCAAPEVERPGRPGEGVDPARWMEKVV